MDPAKVSPRHLMRLGVAADALPVRSLKIHFLALLMPPTPSSFRWSQRRESSRRITALRFCIVAVARTPSWHDSSDPDYRARIDSDAGGPLPPSADSCTDPMSALRSMGQGRGCATIVRASPDMPDLADANRAYADRASVAPARILAALRSRRMLELPYHGVIEIRRAIQQRSAAPMWKKGTASSVQLRVR